MKINKKKIIIISSVILFLILGIFLFNYLRVKYAKIEVTLKDNLDVEFLSKAKVSDFITSINGKIIDDYEIDTKSIGEKDIKFNFINDDKIKVNFEYKVNVIDRTSPVVWLNNSYTIYKGSDVDIVKNILCGDNEDGGVKCTLEGDYDYNTVLDYPLTFVATDRSGNETRKDFILHVIEPPKKNSNQVIEPTVTSFNDILNTYKDEKTKIGIDVSRWQGDIDFEKIKNAGVDFIIIKVGGTKGTNEEFYIDSKFEENIKKANEYDIPVGIYFYSYANSTEHAKNDANWLLEQIKPYKVDLPIAFDWEDWKNFNDYHLSFFGLTTMAEEFLKIIENAGYKGMLYSSKSYLEKIWLETSYDKWLAHYTSKTNYEGSYKFWQLCDDGKIDGINGPVDIDIMYVE